LSQRQGSEAMPEMNGEIVVGGAGIGGLTLALALLRRGIDVVIHEQAGQMAEVGAGIQISPNGTRALADLGVLDELTRVSSEPDAKRIRLWNTGQNWPLFDLGPDCVAQYGYPYLMIHRGDLQSVLVAAVRKLKPDAIRMGSRIVDFVQDAKGVTAILADGSRASGTVLVGADGVHSQIRSAIFGAAKATYSGCSAWRGVIPAERLPERLRISSGVNWVGPGRHVVTYPLRRGELINFVGVVETDEWNTESWTARGTHAECAADFAGWHEDVHALIDNIDVHYRWALLGRAPIASWHKGRVVLLGDACHPMLPFMAQGAVMAIEDGIILARCLETYGEDCDKAFSGYEAARIERANRCVVAADRNRAVFHSDRLIEPADAERYAKTQWNEAKVRERYHWLFSFDPITCPIEPMAAALADG
jgi:salicylate hydroxylase